MTRTTTPTSAALPRVEYNGFPRRDPPHVLVIRRVFNAQRMRVWTAWIDPAHARRWMGPRGFTATHLEGDVRPQGAWRACLRRDADGSELWQGGLYLDVVAPARLAFSFAWDGTEGRQTHTTRISLSFTERAGNTQLDFRQEMFESVAERDGHQIGWNSAFDRLADYLAECAAR